MSDYKIDLRRFREGLLREERLNLICVLAEGEGREISHQVEQDSQWSKITVKKFKILGLSIDKSRILNDPNSLRRSIDKYVKATSANKATGLKLLQMMLKLSSGSLLACCLIRNALKAWAERDMTTRILNVIKDVMNKWRQQPKKTNQQQLAQPRVSSVSQLQHSTAFNQLGQLSSILHNEDFPRANRNEFLN